MQSQSQAMGCAKHRDSTYISGSFCVSNTAAMGIPKFDAGPQKSAQYSHQYLILFISCWHVQAENQAGIPITYVLSRSSPTRGWSESSH